MKITEIVELQDTPLTFYDKPLDGSDPNDSLDAPGESLEALMQRQVDQEKQAIEERNQ